MSFSAENKLPLQGKRVLLARPEEPADRLAAELRHLGAEVLYQPVIRLSPPDDRQAVDVVIRRRHEFHWVIFTSANGVRFFFERVQQLGEATPAGFPPTAAIGPGTAAALGRFRLKAELMPEQYRAEALAEAIIRQHGGRLSGKRILLVRGNRGRPVLAELLRAAGAVVEQVVAYLTGDVETADAEIHKLLSAGEIAWIAVTSSAIAHSLARLFGEELRKSKLAAISPITGETLRRLGFDVAAEAEEYDFAGLARAIASAEQGR